MRYASFVEALLKLQVPAGTTMAMSQGVGVAENLNRCIERASGAWVWRIDDDHDFPPTLLLDLLSRDVDVVAPLTVRRVPPFQPCVWGEYDAFLRTWPTKTWADLPPDPDALLEVGACGGAGLLVRRHVIEAMTRPVFEIGRTRPDALSEDLWFCKKARDAGFKIYVDCKHRMGHTSPVTYWPAQRDGRWCVGVDLGNDCSIELVPAG